MANAVCKKCSNLEDGVRFLKLYEDEQAISNLLDAASASRSDADAPAGAADRRVNFADAHDSQGRRKKVAGLDGGVGVGMDVSVGTRTHAFGVLTTLGAETLQKLAPEPMTAIQRARLGEQIVDAVAQPGMSVAAESGSEMVEALSDALDALTATSGADPGELLGGHRDKLWKKDNRVSLKLITTLDDLHEHSSLLQAAQRDDLLLTKNATEEVYMMMGYLPTEAEALTLAGGIYRVSVDTYSSYLSLHMHLLHLALKSGFPAAKIELDYHVKKLVAIRKRMPSRIQVMMCNYTYLRDLMHSGWSCLALELLHRKAMQSKMGSLFPPAGGNGPVQHRDASCGHCGSCIHGMNKSQAECPWKTKSRTQARKSARDAAIAAGVAGAAGNQGGVPPPAAPDG